MTDRAYFQRIAGDIAVLYELSLAVGRSLDLHQNCDHFLSTVMARRNLGFASVWLRRDALSGRVGDDASLRLVYANPRVHVEEESLPAGHPLAMRVAAEPIFSVSFADAREAGLVTERGLRDGAFAIYALGEVGFLKLASMARHSPFPDEELRHLRSVVAQFAVSLHGCLAHGRAVQEVRERQRAEAALRASEERLNAILQHAPTVIFAKDADGRYLFANRRMEALIGLPAEEAIDRTDFDLFPAPTAAAFRENDQRVLREGVALEFEETLHLEDGEHAYLTVKFPIVDVGGAPAVCGISMDVSERRRNEREGRRLERQIQRAQKLESLGVLAGGIAHDFNNLLTGVLGNASLAIKHTRSDSAVRRNLEQIETAAMRASDLTNQLLAYAGRGPITMRPVDLSVLVEEMAQLLETVISKKATLRCELPAGLPPFEGDPAQVRQIVMNLITNASDALAGENGVIHIETGEVEADAPYLARTWLHDALPGGRYAYLEVRDTGVGMDADTRARIFDPFYSTKFAGRGLGLAAVLGIVRAHKGAIDVSSAPGSGTTVRVLFPCGACGAFVEDAAAALSPRRGWRGDGTVLVVDDDESARTVAGLMMERIGFTVLLARDGEEGVAVFRANAERIVAVLLDLTMPVMGGEEAFEAMHRIRPDVPVVLSSGYTEQVATARFAERGLAGFLQKPYTPDVLAERMRAALDYR